MRLRLAFSFVLLFVVASPAVAERPLRVLTEDAFATECRTDQTDPSNLKRLCVTVQVVRSRLSGGIEQMNLLVSVRENDAEIPVFPPFLPIDSQSFVMDRDGTRAILNIPSRPADSQPDITLPGITVVWDATDDFSSRSFSTKVEKEKTSEGFTKTRLTEREQDLSAAAEGVVGPVTDANGVTRFLTINTGGPVAASDFASGSLIIRKEISRTRLLEGEPDVPDSAE